MNVNLDANPCNHNLKTAFQGKHQTAICPCRPHYSALLHLQTASSEDPKQQMLCEKTQPIQSKTAFPTKKQSLLLDNNENGNSSLGNIILKSDFPTNHTQLVSNAMFLSDYGIPADFFNSFKFMIFSIFTITTKKETKPLMILCRWQVTKGKPLPH